jgi:hypothetical protein
MVNIPPGAIVPVQQDAYSPTLLMSIEDARKVQNAERLGGAYTRKNRKRVNKRRTNRKKTRKSK